MMIIYRPLLTNVMHEANAGYENMVEQCGWNAEKRAA